MLRVKRKRDVLLQCILIDFYDFQQITSLSRIKANKETPKGKVYEKENDISNKWN
jgi:hypothetical protein